MKKIIITTFALSTILTTGCDKLVEMCIIQGGDPYQCHQQWGGDNGVDPPCAPIDLPDGTTCCQWGTGPAEDQCGS